METKNILVLCMLISSSYAASTGGWKQLNVTDAEIITYAKASVQELDLQSNSFYQSRLVEVKDAKVQVVAGLKYRFVITKAASSCRKGAKDVEIDECDPDLKTLEECTVDLWVQPWKKTQEITAQSCARVSGASSKEPLLGGDGHDLGSRGAFEAFRSKYNKQYSAEEAELRYSIFHDNMKFAQELNENELGTATYGATHLADLTREEFKKFYTSGSWNTEYDPFLKPAQIPTDTPPDAWDWRDHNAVSEVKNQGSCGSCWAFSTTGNVEGQWAIKRGKLTDLSEQELVDCDKLDDGCNGGLPTNAYKEIIRLGGLEGEKDYPYEAEDEKCSFNKSEVAVKISGAVNISQDEDDMKAWLWKNGPISIGINAMAMQFYFGGVAHPWSIFCPSDNLDHGVLIVGYGVKTGWFSDKPYWIIKNSWGSSWGESGYYLLYRGDGVCGCNRMCTSAVVN